MRTLPVIHDKWKSGGPFIGDRKPVTRCTVQMAWPELSGSKEPDLFLRKTQSGGLGQSTSRGVPMRYWQKRDNSQLEMEIPNISSVSIDRSVDQDAGTFQIEIKNQWMYVNGQAPTQSVLGQPGYFSPTRGNTNESRARWGHEVNDWNNVLVPNAVIRVYTGFGGETGEIHDQVAAGNLCLYGVFLVDEVSITSSAALSIRGRDMMKLLIDQQLFPPLVPSDKYPLGYYRWSYEERGISNRGRHVPLNAQSTTPGDKRTVYRDSSVDRWYGCVDTETEALTNRGWMALDEIRETDLIYGMDPAGRGEWQPLRGLSSFEVKDELMHHWKGNGFDALTTWNHRWLVSAPTKRHEQRWTMSREMKTGWFIPTRAQYAEAPTEKKYSDAFVEIIGWYWTEGTAGFISEGGGRSQNAMIYQSREVNSTNCDRIIQALTTEFGDPGMTLRDGVSKWVKADYGKGECYRLSLKLQPQLDEVAPNKVLSPEFLLALTQDQIDLLFEVSIAADGWRVSATHAFLRQKTAARTKAFEMLAVLAGYRVTSRLTDQDDLHLVSCVDGSDGFYFKRSRHETMEMYTGTVWCPTVKHGNWLARRNGSTFFTGNSNASIYGHRATDCLDGNPHSYALSVGNSQANRPFATDWWEFDCGEAMNAVFVHPWAGNFHMYVSVMVGGVWQNHPSPPVDDGGVIPYDSAHLFATQSPAVNTGANIPYVGKFVVPHEASGEFVLSQVYNAERVRVTFRNHAFSGLGTWKYRVGMREFRIRGAEVATEDSNSVANGPTIWRDTWVQAAGGRYVPDKPFSQGYVTAGRFGDFDSFGDARPLKTTRSPETTPPEVLSVSSAVRFNREGTGYYVLNTTGTLTCRGEAEFYGDPVEDGFIGGTDDSTGFFWDMAVTHTGKGYWILNSNGSVWPYGDAVDYGIQFPVSADINVTSIEACPYAYGYWVLRNDGTVYTAGAARHMGNIPKTGPNAMKFVVRGVEGLAVFVNASEGAQCIRATTTGEGYWCLTTKGRVLAFGDANDYGQPRSLEEHANNLFLECYWELIPSPTDDGYLLLHASGKVSPHGDIENFNGPMPGGHRVVRSDGNYKDYIDIIKDLILWSGFLLYDPQWPSNQPAPVYAGLESTGAFAKERLPDDIFDKRPVIDAITSLKEVVGYITYVDSQGRFVFRSPNWWHIGNFFEDGQHIEYLLDIDERLQLTSYQVSTADDPVRSSIIISSHDPYADYSGTVTSSYRPPSATMLRGLVKPAMWVNDHFINKDEQEIMAELIGLHITFQERVGQIEFYSHPGLEIDDQVRIYERQTGESFVHYVRGISFNHDLDSGDYKSTLTTHWLAAGAESGDVVGGERLPVSSALAERIQQQQYGKLQRETAPEVI